jgi:hypothetical protein|uniref:WLM domain-containing protein n=1 Tax=viral metagenome TaxID=1070528 RepID=A0A6C0INK8_9ZZZZ
MKNITSLYLKYLAFFIGAILVYQLYQKSNNYDLKCIIAQEDGKTYCVRDRKKLQQSAELMAKVTNNMSKMVEYMRQNHPDDERTQRLVDGFNPNSISETLPTSKLTAYSENKGEKIALCLNKNKKKGEDELIDINTLTFVALHELSHIMTKSIGHKQDFWNNFKFLLENAKTSQIYNPVDYNKNPSEYCGMTLNDNPYFDLV